MRIFLGILIGVGVAGGAGVLAYPDAAKQLLEKVGYQREDAAFLQCEKAVKRMLKSPSSYKRDKNAVGGYGMKPNSVLMTYEAHNSFGASILGSAECLFEYEPSRYASTSTERKGKFRMSAVKIDGTNLEGLDLTIAKATLLGIDEKDTELKPAGS